MFARVWTPVMIEQHILERRDTEPLNSFYYATHYPALHAAATRIFGSWKSAIEHCGIDYAEVRKYRNWDRETVLQKIRCLAEEGKPISSQKIQRKEKALYMAAIHHFRSWGNAVREAGISYSGIRLRRSMSPREIREEIIRLYREGVDLSYPAIRKSHLYLQAAGMRKLGGGSWAVARRVCGIRTDYRIPPKKRKLLSLPPDL